MEPGRCQAATNRIFPMLCLIREVGEESTIETENKSTSLRI